MKDLTGKEITPPHGPPTSVGDKLMAIELLQAVNPRKKWTRQSIAKEARHIRLLRVKDNVPVTDIDQTLIYHCSHLRDQYHPRAFSAQTFRVKYEQIRAAYIRANPQHEQITITKESMAIVTRLKMLGWKRGSVEQLPGEVQRGVDWVLHLRSVIRATQSQSTGAEELCWQALLDRIPRNWVDVHFTKAHRRLHNWQDWNGDLRMVRMFHTNKECWSVIVTILEQYAGSKTGTRLSVKLLETMDEH